MNWTADRCMNTFTRDQIARMHHVLENSPRRSTLLTSPGLAGTSGSPTLQLPAARRTPPPFDKHGPVPSE